MLKKVSHSFRDLSVFDFLRPRILITGSFGGTGIGIDPAIASFDPAIQTIAKTVWVLWAYDMERVWSLLLQWVVGPSIQREACCRIIETGFTNSYFSPEDAFRKIEGWFDNDADVDAAASLIEFVLPAMSAGTISNLTLNWKKESFERSLRAFSTAMQHVFNRDPVGTIKLFSNWIRKGEKIYSDLIASTLREIGSQADVNPAYDLALERQLMALRASSSDVGLNKTIQRLVKTIRDRRSKAKNRTARSDHPERLT